MLFFDQLKRKDPHLQLLAWIVLGGLLILLAGLWWVQIVQAHEFENHLVAQSYRTVRVPALRGQILDRNGIVLADNRATYNVSLYLNDLRPSFDAAFDDQMAALRTQRRAAIAQEEKRLDRSLTRTERRKFAFTTAQLDALRQTVRYEVTSNIVFEISRRLHEPIALDEATFERLDQARRPMPYPVVQDLNSTQIARFEEQANDELPANLEVQAERFYPYGTTAAHVLGYVHSDDSSIKGEEAYFDYRLPDYRGVVGIEGYFDRWLHGRAGEKSVLVNNLGYRQDEQMITEPEAGSNVVLTLDLRLQQAAERAMARHVGRNARGAVVVMDVHSGDILAMVSSPESDPNYFIQGFPPGEFQRWTNQDLRVQINRATYEIYAPGSIFKTVTGLACLEAGLDPNQTIENPGYIYVGRRYINDLAPPGRYDFVRALMRSSNTYFITNGTHVGGIENIVKLAHRLHLGEKSGIPTLQDSGGTFPSLQRVNQHWYEGDTANICIGQGEMAVTPLQMTVMTAALANGGKVLWPRLVDRIEPQNPVPGDTPCVFPKGRVRDELGVHARNLQIVREAMLKDTEDREGTGRAAAVPGLHICGKTGTAQVQDPHGRNIGNTLWFTSFAPYEAPRYAVLVMVEWGEGGFGGTICAPVAHDIYAAILKLEQSSDRSALASRN